MAPRSPRCLLSFLHDEYQKGRVSFCTSRSINRLRAALNDIASAAGGHSAARHAARFNFIGKSRRLHDDIIFAENTISSFDKSRVAAAKKSELAARRIALKIHLGCIKGSARRKAGSWATQSNTTASLGPSECKVFCGHIIIRNRKRAKSQSLSKPVVLSLELGIQKILSSNWKSIPIGRIALKSFIKVLTMDDRRILTGLYVPVAFRGSGIGRQLAAACPLVRHSPHFALKEGMSFLDIGAGIGSISALVARTSSIRITSIEPDATLRKTLMKNLTMLGLQSSVVNTSSHLPWTVKFPLVGSTFAEYFKLVQKTVDSSCPDAIRLDFRHAELFLPVVLPTNNVCVVAVDTDINSGILDLKRLLLRESEWRVTFAKKWCSGNNRSHDKVFLLVKK